MKISHLFLRCSVSALLSIGLTAPAFAEFSCAPAGSPTKFDIQNDSAFPQALKIWQKVTAGRSNYVEGNSGKFCKPFPIPGYKNFPTERCSYSDADAGAVSNGAKPPGFPALPAQIVLLDPSSVQLAMWSVNACEVNMAKGPKMASCLTNLSAVIIDSNGATFPVVGSIVESRCEWDQKFTPCKGPDDMNRAPYDTFFRDGVSVGYVDSAPWHWQPIAYTPDQYDALFDTQKSDQSITQWFRVSRVSSALREDWQVWRRHIGKPDAPDGVNPQGFNLASAGWGTVSRDVQQKACVSDSNELMDALVYSRKFAQ